MDIQVPIPYTYVYVTYYKRSESGMRDLTRLGVNQWQDINYGLDVDL